MKKLLCCLLALIALLPAVLAEGAGTVNVTFEDGFSLSLPADWVSYEVAPELQDIGTMAQAAASMALSVRVTFSCFSSMRLFRLFTISPTMALISVRVSGL